MTVWDVLWLIVKVSIILSLTLLVMFVFSAMRISGRESEEERKQHGEDSA